MHLPTVDACTLSPHSMRRSLWAWTFRFGLLIAVIFTRVGMAGPGVRSGQAWLEAASRLFMTFQDIDREVAVGRAYVHRFRAM